MTPLDQMCVRISKLGACQDVIDWVKELPSDTTPQQAWDSCKEPAWMLWLLGRCKRPEKTKIVRVACAIARSVLHLVPAGEERPRKAIEAAEAWADNPSAYAADDAAHAGYAAYAAADAAAEAAEAAKAAKAAAYAAAYAAYAAAYAADAAAYVAADAACNTVRGFFPNPPELD